jgi:hypothetical protein
MFSAPNILQSHVACRCGKCDDCACATREVYNLGEARVTVRAALDNWVAAQPSAATVKYDDALSGSCALHLFGNAAHLDPDILRILHGLVFPHEQFAKIYWQQICVPVGANSVPRVVEDPNRTLSTTRKAIAR